MSATKNSDRFSQKNNPKERISIPKPAKLGSPSAVGFKPKYTKSSPPPPTFVDKAKAVTKQAVTELAAKAVSSFLQAPPGKQKKQILYDLLPGQLQDNFGDDFYKRTYTSFVPALLDPSYKATRYQDVAQPAIDLAGAYYAAPITAGLALSDAAGVGQEVGTGLLGVAGLVSVAKLMSAVKTGNVAKGLDAVMPLAEIVGLASVVPIVREKLDLDVSGLFSPLIYNTLGLGSAANKIKGFFPSLFSDKVADRSKFKTALVDSRLDDVTDEKYLGYIETGRQDYPEQWENDFYRMSEEERLRRPDLQRTDLQDLEQSLLEGDSLPRQNRHIFNHRVLLDQMRDEQRVVMSQEEREIFLLDSNAIYDAIHGDGDNEPILQGHAQWAQMDLDRRGLEPAQDVIYLGTKTQEQRLFDAWDYKARKLGRARARQREITDSAEQIENYNYTRQLYYEAQDALADWQRASNSPEEIARKDANAAQLRFTDFVSLSDDQYLERIRQNNEWKNLKEEILSNRNLTEQDLINFQSNGNYIDDRYKIDRENLHPQSIYDHNNFVSLINSPNANLYDISEIEKPFQQFGDALNRLTYLPGAPTRFVFDSEQNSFERNLIGIIDQAERGNYFAGLEGYDNFQTINTEIRLINKWKEMLRDVQSRPPIPTVITNTPSIGEHLEEATKLLGGRNEQIGNLRALYEKPYTPAPENFEGFDHKKILSEETEKLVRAHPEMYVEPLDYLHNLGKNFYSRVNNFVENLEIKKPMTGEEWKNLLYRDKSRLPQAELDYIGVKDDKKFDKERLYTQEEMLDWLQENGIKLKDTVFQQWGTRYSTEYNFNDIDTAKGARSMLDDQAQLDVNMMFPGGGPKKRSIQVIMVGEQGEQVLDPEKPRREGHPQYDKIKNPIGRLEYETMSIGGAGDKTIWLHEIQGPKEPYASNAPSFLQFDSKGSTILLKRLLMLAYANGYTSIQWTNGPTQMQNRYGQQGLGDIYDKQLAKTMNKIIETTGIKMGQRARPDMPETGLHWYLDLTSPEMQQFLSKPMPIAKINPQQGKEQRSIT